MSDYDQNLIPRYVRIKEFCILIQKNCFSTSGKDMFMKHHSSFTLLKPALVNCFSLQFGFTTEHSTSEIQEFIQFISNFNKDFAHELRKKLFKIVLYTNDLSGGDVAEQLLSPFFALSDTLLMEFVEFQFHFSDCSNLSLILPTDALIKHLCFIDSNSTINLSEQQQHCNQFSKYFTVSLYFHTLPFNIQLKLNKIEDDIVSVSPPYYILRLRINLVPTCLILIT